jgi:hypothetical protein
MNQLPVSRIVNVSVNLSPKAAQAQSLSNLLLLGTSTVLDTKERYREYSRVEDIATDFGTSAPEYLAALVWFSQRPQPTNLIIGRWLQAAAVGGLRCAPLSVANQALAVWNAITTGSVAITKDGAAPVNVTALNFSGAASLAAVAAIIQAAAPAGTTVVYNTTFQRFELSSNLQGAASAIAFLTPTGTGTDISTLMGGRSTSSGAYVYAGAALETPVAAVALLDDMIGQRFYGVKVLGLVPGVAGDNTALLAVSAYVEAATTKHVHAITSQEAGALLPQNTTDLPYLLKAALYLRTLCQYSSFSPYAALSAASRLFAVDYEGDQTAITLKFKTEPGVQAENLSTTQANALKSKNCNVFVAYNNDTTILEEGVMTSGEFADTVTGTDWLAVTTQRDVYNALNGSPTKIPQTDEGMGILKAVVEKRCQQAVDNGLAAPGVWQSNGFGLLKTGDYMSKGFYVYSAPVSTQSVANRAARMAQPIQVALKLAGAIHSSNVTINVNN